MVTASDYYPFGMTMPSRSYSSGSKYRYGFNGKENDNSTGEGNLDFGARVMDVRIGRWLAVDAMRNASPSETPYRFGHDNPLRFKDPDGNWEEDGHFWTVYAMCAAKGLSKARAFEIASKAEMYDHYVHKDVFGTISLSMHPLRENSFVAWGSDGGLGTWADPKLQGYYHALTGGLQIFANSNAKHNILVDGDLNQLHTLGDSWSHSYIDDKGVRKMWGRGPYIFGVTLEHKYLGGHGHGNADNISKRPKEYSFYVADLNNIMNNDLFAFRAEVKNSDPDRKVFNYVQQNGKTKDNNIFLLKSYSEYIYGSKLFASTDKNKITLLAGLFKEVGIKYETCSKTEVTNHYATSNSVATTYTLEVKK